MVDSGFSFNEIDKKSEDFFKTVYRAFEKASRSSQNSTDRYYRIGGYPICLRFADPALIPYITPALDHMLCEAVSSPALTICICDSLSTRTALPFLGPLNEYLAYTHTRRYKDLKVYMHIERGLAGASPILNMLNTQTNVGIYWVRDVFKFPYHEIAAPLRVILHWWMLRHGRQIIHGGAVGLPEGGVIIAGKAGAGKSTTSLACLDSKLLHIGEDWVLLQQKPKPMVCTLYNSAKLNHEHMSQRLPQLLPMVSNLENLDKEKAMIFLNKFYKHKIGDRVPLKAILLPYVTDLTVTEVKKVSPTAALAGLIPDTFYIDSFTGTNQESLENLHQLVQQVPAYALQVGTDLAGISGAILDLLAKI
jgi:hypothetical protein